MTDTLGILLIGAGGHALSCIEVIEAGGVFRIDGLIAPDVERGTVRHGYHVIGDDSDLPALATSHRDALVCIGQIKSPEARMRVFAQLLELGYRLPPVVSPHARVSRRAIVGRGSIVMHGAVINAGARVGENCIVNTAAVVEHDAVVGDHCHVSTGAIVNGDVAIGAGCLIGSGSRIREGIKIGARCIVGMGAIVMENLPDGTVLRNGVAR